jgi:hypothetical protein
LLYLGILTSWDDDPGCDEFGFVTWTGGEISFWMSKPQPLWLWPWQDVKVANPFTPKKVQHHHLCGVIPSQTIPLSEAVGFEESHNGSHRDEGV